jgi:hypothetical protein
MTDLMNRIEYQKACAYRVQEALTDVLSRWDNCVEVDGKIIEQTQHLLQEVQMELDYFQKKIGERK